MKFQRLTAFLLAMLMAVSFAACGGSNPDITDDITSGNTADGSTAKDNVSTGDGKNTADFTPTSKKIKVWAWSQIGFYDEFAREFPDYQLDYSIATDNNLATLAAAIAAGNQPDVFYVGFHTSAPLVNAYYNDLLTPLNDYLSKDPEYNYESLPKAFFDLTTFNNKTLSVFTDLSVMGLVWNKDLFEAAGLNPEKPPETWSEMYNYAKQLTKFDSKGMPVQLGYKGAPPVWMMLGQNGTYYTRQDGSGVNVNTPELTKTLEYVMSFPKVYGGDEKLPTGTKIDFGQGNVGMTLADLCFIMDYVGTPGLNIGVAPLPKPDGVDKQVIGAYLPQWYGIPKGADNPNGGWMFMKWLMSKGISSYLEGLAQTNPERWFPTYIAHKPTREKIYEKCLANVTDENIKNVLKARDEIYDKINFVYPLSPIHNTWDPVFGEGVNMILRGDLTIKDGLELLQNRGDQMHKEWRQEMEAKGIKFDN